MVHIGASSLTCCIHTARRCVDIGAKKARDHKIVLVASFPDLQLSSWPVPARGGAARSARLHFRINPQGFWEGRVQSCKAATTARAVATTAATWAASTTTATTTVAPNTPTTTVAPRRGAAQQDQNKKTTSAHACSKTTTTTTTTTSLGTRKLKSWCSMYACSILLMNNGKYRFYKLIPTLNNLPSSIVNSFN